MPTSLRLFSRRYHARMPSTLFSLLKDSISRDAVARTAKEHEGRFDTDGDEDPRESGYYDLVTDYYKLVTDFYEYGWGKSFHFAPRHTNESFKASLARHQHFIAHKLDLQPGMRVADLGCGVGGPMREIISFSGANVVGINISAYQLELARKYTDEAGLGHLAEFLECDFNDVDEPDGSFDAAFAIETTVHAPDLVRVFSEARRLLKPGACFATYEWCLTDRFDVDDPHHVQLKNDIELGAATQDLRHTSDVDAAFAEAGFELLETRDLAEQTTPGIPWYQPLVGSGVSLARFRSSSVGRQATYRSLRALETIKVVPSGASEVSRLLNLCANALAEGGRLGLFTPMYFALARNPA
ncbi:MAG: methyltransferase domain-containing protein [Acidimicrobiaceae bacterium]|nr:methyltransferase domain-containing protein [Acidimicrobiaceae bacterium]MXW74658.1 methyltransferase domain-containing protein [Acidimicrobiaceae bacterium]MYC41369.1 methyltransferase domain-containing protein [Acidimicrobiaceae bacterium]MYD05364.1 methyltransferase domain-containing protein [Acidimicrobiaceae bacterium]MYH88728.1 methyltransferase domain-containing protein [Acidimicrobiaceae bacterium]